MAKRLSFSDRLALLLPVKHLIGLGHPLWKGVDNFLSLAIISAKGR